MKTILLLVAALLAFSFEVLPPGEPPQATITNGLVTATLYLPDAQRGYYQGTRFDWSGAFKSLNYKGHRYVDEWFEDYNPKTHDAINGPAEEFVGLDYANAEPGRTFIKIGVGALRKPDDKPYSFSRYYDVVNPGKWSVNVHRNGQSANALEFSHALTDSTGYGYRYTKIVRLTPGKPELVLEHRLTNTGRKPIETSVYNHNFWVIDRQPTGPEMTISFPFGVKGEGTGFGTIINPQGNRLVYARGLVKPETVFSAGLQGFGPTATDYDFRIDNLKSGAGLRATADQPMEKLVFWACPTTSCPEPYLRLRAAPGQTLSWTIRYEFYQKPVR